jgi:hypothetical protein
MYKQIKTRNGEISNEQIVRLLDNAVIPFVEGNTDYQEYLKWLAEGNTPKPAEEQLT